MADIHYVDGVRKYFVPASRVCADEAEDALALLREGCGDDEESACRSSKDGRGDELGAATWISVAGVFIRMLSNSVGNGTRPDVAEENGGVGIVCGEDGPV